MPRRHGGFRSRTVGGFAIGLVLALAGTEAASAAPFDSGSLPGSASIGSLSSSAEPENPADGTWGQNPLVLSAAEGSVRSHALTWQPKGSPHGDLKAIVSGPLDGIARLDLGLVTPAEPGKVEIPLTLTMPARAAESYAGTVQLADDNGPIGTQLQVTVTTGFADADHVPGELMTPSPDRIVASDDFERVTDELLVTADTGGPSDDVIRAVAASTGAAIYGADSSAGLYQLRFREKSVNQVEELKSQIRAHSGITSVTSNYVASDSAASYVEPNDKWAWNSDAATAQNWALWQIDAPGAWEKLKRGGDGNIRIGVIDVGPVFDSHEDLRGNMYQMPSHATSNRSFIEKNGDHATHVAGIACAEGDNGIGVTGIAQYCDLRDYPLQNTPDKKLFLSRIMKSMNDAGKGGSRVVNMSFGFSPETFHRPWGCDNNNPTLAGSTKQELRDGLAQIVMRYPQTLWVASAGNECMNAGNSFPAALAGDDDRLVSNRVVAVAASDRYQNWAPYSNYGNSITIVAPGGDDTKHGGITSAVPFCKKEEIRELGTSVKVTACESGYGEKFGTSMAAPYVTGTAALMFSAGSYATPAMVKNCFATGMSENQYLVRPGADRKYPTLDAADAVQCILDRDPTKPVDPGGNPGEGGTTAPQVEPAESVSAGRTHSCAVLESGGVRCWGGNFVGQLGDGTTDNHPTPVDVVGISDARSVSAGFGTSCVVRTSGRVSCWGNNSNGQLGNGGSTELSPTPVDVVGITDARSVSVGHGHACAVLVNGKVRCWGLNLYGQLGGGTTDDRWTPVDVVGISDARSVSAGVYRSCATLASGTVSCWGNNWDSYLSSTLIPGIQDKELLTPVAVPGITDARSISVHQDHACSELASNTVRCWGINSIGQLGDGNLAHSSSMADAIGVTETRSVSAGYDHSCAALTSGGVRCWGSNFFGQIGDGTNRNRRLAPVDVIGIANARSVSAGHEHSCAVLTSGEIRCWGDNSWGQLGDGSTADQVLPTAAIGFGPSDGQS